MTLKTLLSLGVLAVAASTSCAGGLVFSKDGNSLFVPIADDAGERTALRVNLEKNTFTAFNPQDYGAPQNVWYRAVSNSGFLIGAAEGDLYATDLEKKKTVKLGTLPKGMWVADLAYDPGNEWVVVSAYKSAEDAGKGRAATSLFVIRKSGGKATPVKTYNVTAIDALAYGPNNRLYFSAEGDLWEGSVGQESAHDEAADAAMTLEAERVAPLAVRESRSETQGARPMAIRQLAISGNRVLIQMGPVKGFGFAAAAESADKIWPVASLTIPEPKTDTSAEDKDELLRHTRRSSQWLESIRMREQTSGLGFTGASPKGDRVALVDARGLDMLDSKTLTVKVILTDNGEEETYEASRETE